MQCAKCVVRLPTYRNFNVSCWRSSQAIPNVQLALYGRRMAKPPWKSNKAHSCFDAPGPDLVPSLLFRLTEHLTGDGPTVFEHVCRMGLEGVVSKRTDAPYRSDPSKTWVKSKNPASEAVRREREEEWR